MEASTLPWSNGWKGRRNWKAQYERQNGLCYLCGDPTPVEKMTKDHVVPRAKGGSPHWCNIRLACEPCNSVKADRPLTNQERLDRQGLIFNHSGKCGKIVR